MKNYGLLRLLLAMTEFLSLRAAKRRGNLKTSNCNIDQILLGVEFDSILNILHVFLI